jgi:DNA-binding transcriptional MerR regulator
MSKGVDLREHLGKTYNFGNRHDGSQKIGTVVGIDICGYYEDGVAVLLAEMKDSNVDYAHDFDEALSYCDEEDFELLKDYKSKKYDPCYEWFNVGEIEGELTPFTSNEGFLEEETALKEAKVSIKKSLAEQLEELKRKMDELQQQIESVHATKTEEDNKNRFEKLKDRIKKDEWFAKEDLQFIWENSAEEDIFFMEDIDMSTHKSQMIIDIDRELYAFEVIEDKHGYCELPNEMQRLISVECVETQKVIHVNTYSLCTGREYVRRGVE